MQQAAADREMLYSVAQARVADETYDISLMSSTTRWLSSRHISCRQFLTHLHGAAAARQRTQAQSSWSEAGEMSASSTHVVPS